MQLPRRLYWPDSSAWLCRLSPIEPCGTVDCTVARSQLNYCHLTFLLNRLYQSVSQSVQACLIPAKPSHPMRMQPVLTQSYRSNYRHCSIVLISVPFSVPCAVSLGSFRYLFCGPFLWSDVRVSELTFPVSLRISPVVLSLMPPHYSLVQSFQNFLFIPYNGLRQFACWSRRTTSRSSPVTFIVLVMLCLLTLPLVLTEGRLLLEWLVDHSLERKFIETVVTVFDRVLTGSD